MTQRGLTIFCEYQGDQFDINKMNLTTEIILGQEERGAILSMSFRGTFKSLSGKDARKKII